MTDHLSANTRDVIRNSKPKLVSTITSKLIRNVIILFAIVNKDSKQALIDGITKNIIVQNDPYTNYY